VETLADAHSESDGGDDGKFFRPGARTFQLPDELKGTPLEQAVDRLRFEHFDLLQDIGSREPHPKYYNFERHVNNTFSSAIAAVHDAQKKKKRRVEEELLALQDIEALFRDHPTLFNWAHALISGPDLIPQTERHWRHFRRASRAPFMRNRLTAHGSGGKGGGGGRERGGEGGGGGNGAAELGGCTVESVGREQVGGGGGGRGLVGGGEGLGGGGGEGDDEVCECIGEVLVRELGVGATAEEAQALLAQAHFLKSL
jgi:hypothetical protein